MWLAAAAVEGNQGEAECWDGDNPAEDSGRERGRHSMATSDLHHTKLEVVVVDGAQHSKAERARGQKGRRAAGLD